VGGGAGEPGQQRLGGGGAVLDRGGIPDDLVVAGVDQVPADRPGQRRAQPRPGAGVVGGGPVQLDLVDLLDARQQVDVQQPGDAEPDLGLYVDKSSGSPFSVPAQ